MSKILGIDLGTTNSCMAVIEAGEPKVLEPDRCESWDWYDFDALPKPLFAPELITLDSYKTGRAYYDA